jgi:hypothetical protein
MPQKKGLKSHIATTRKATMAIPPTLCIPGNHKGLSLHLSSAEPQAEYSLPRWMGSILAALRI